MICKLYSITTLFYCSLVHISLAYIPWWYFIEIIICVPWYVSIIFFTVYLLWMTVIIFRWMEEYPNKDSTSHHARSAWCDVYRPFFGVCTVHFFGVYLSPPKNSDCYYCSFNLQSIIKCLIFCLTHSPHWQVFNIRNAHMVHIVY